ncbi:DUF971 domain-containing protein [Saccharospirillum sp. HFRX-1]|uniref:gamma-butyrobetaine hydroxylase-like domain-containing protein n=1 Tax=unclassified Saccharospirillum TaxID=2633430 RepID=UPI003712207A
MSQTPTALNYRRADTVLEITWPDGLVHELSAEYLRVHSRSAEVRGHGPGQAVLQHGKKGVGINAIEPTGRYAVRLVFDDGHDSGLYDWDYLRELGVQFEAYWQAYLHELEAAGKTREPMFIRAKQL